MRLTIGFSVGLTMCVCAYGQWEPAGVPFRILEMGNIHKDTTADALYFCGESSLDNDFQFNDGAVPVYTNGQWDTLGVFGGRVQTMVRWNDTLIIGGPFIGYNGVPSPRNAAYWNGSTWLPFGLVDGYIYRYKVIEDQLYAIGEFETTNGQNWTGIAQRQNGEWVEVGSFSGVSEPLIQDLVSWNGTLYTTGVISYSAGGPNHIAYLENGEWLPLGPGIQGGFGNGRSLAVYNDELYVSGGIPIGSGNVGHGIMRWDGEQFHPVGTGFQDENNTYNNSVGASELEVYGGKLWACGTFSYAGNVPARIATWDGIRWCGLPDGPQQQINTIEFFHDTLFASCQGDLNGEPVNCAVKFVGDVYADTCSYAVGVTENVLPRSTLRAYRRSDGLVEVSGLPSGKHTIEVFDDAGRLVFTTAVNTTAGTPACWSMPAVGGGLHLIRTGAQAVRFLGP